MRPPGQGDSRGVCMCFVIVLSSHLHGILGNYGPGMLQPQLNSPGGGTKHRHASAVITHGTQLGVWTRAAELDPRLEGRIRSRRQVGGAKRAENLAIGSVQ